MIKNLVIVESPAKAKTIEKFLGKDFTVMSSYGHIRDLAKKDLGIEKEKGYKPKYIQSPDKKNVIKELRSASKEAEMVWLASDEDREGEAIAWHLFEVLKLDAANTKRIVFHEITPKAIKNAIENPREIDINLVDAQQARRVLDRLVGFELSPLLWKKVKPSLSAGRVQSVAVRLLVEREREIIAFKPDSAFKITAEFTDSKSGKLNLSAELNKRLKTSDQVQDFYQTIKGHTYEVSSVQKKPGKKSPAAPFTTSTLQQEAARKFGFSVSQTMALAQRLYEAGHITYMRTDSVNLSNDAISAAENEIKKKLWRTVS
jgi:DNA topoisomerase-1